VEVIMRMQTLIRTAFFLAIGLACGFLLSPLAFAQAQPDFMALKGRWARTDGGYVIDIKSVDPGGQMQAAYYNPNPINVSRAEAARSGAAVTVFIELRGPGYPGSTYTLIHDPKSDQLKGIYHQAVLQKNFEVVFIRGK
jgi:uncharacterized protein (DUF2147 family)